MALSMCRSSKWCLCFMFCYQNVVCICVLFLACHFLCPSHLYLILWNTHIFGEECKPWNHEACHYAVLCGLMLVSVSSKYSAQHSVLKQPLSGFCKDHLITCLQSLNDTWGVCVIINDLSVWFVVDMFHLHIFMMKDTISFTSPWSFDFYKGSAYGSQAWQLNSIC